MSRTFFLEEILHITNTDVNDVLVHLGAQGVGVGGRHFVLSSRHGDECTAETIGDVEGESRRGVGRRTRLQRN